MSQPYDRTQVSQRNMSKLYNEYDKYLDLYFRVFHLFTMKI